MDRISRLLTFSISKEESSVDWEETGINISKKGLQHLRFVDEIVIFVNTIEELSEMLTP